LNGDDQGDLCDPDDDGDGVFDEIDRCPRHIDSSNADEDGDGFGDACDPYPSDYDNDGAIDSLDNCRTTFNPAQQDEDGDHIGTACDPNRNDGPLADSDGDGLNNGQEATLGTDPNSPTAVSTGINTYSDGEPIGMSNPATAGDTVGVAISPAQGIDSIAVAVTDPGGNSVLEQTLIPQSPVAFSFTPGIAGTWAISARLFTGPTLWSTRSIRRSRSWRRLTALRRR
jgi:hypothetical protein